MQLTEMLKTDYRHPRMWLCGRRGRDVYEAARKLATMQEIWHHANHVASLTFLFLVAVGQLFAKRHPPKEISYLHRC